MKLFRDDEQFFSLIYFVNYNSISLPNLAKIADSHGIAVYPRYNKKKILDKIALNMYLRIDHPYKCLCEECITAFFNPESYLSNSVFSPNKSVKIYTPDVVIKTISVKHREKDSSKEVR